MKIKCFNGGFTQIPDNAFVSKIEVKYSGQSESDCDVFYTSKTVCHLKILCTAYNSQYGLVLSQDGRLLISGTWEKGIVAYDIQSGQKVWKYPKGKARTIITYGDELIVARDNSSVFKLDAASGEKKEGELKSGTLENIYPLNGSLFFMNSYRGKCCVVSCRDLGIVHVFDKSETNPHKCLSFIINDVKLSRSGHVVIEGFEDYPDGSFNPSSLVGRRFRRELKSYEFRRNIDLLINF